MRSGVSFNVKFLRYFQVGLNQVAGGSSASSTVTERKRTIKLTADMAMALARGRRRWSRALIFNLSKQERNQDLASAKFPLRIISQKKILLGRRLLRRPSAPARLIAKRILNKRTQVLKRLVPGGNAINDFSVLLDEALDYILSLRAQADLMRRLICAIELAKSPLASEVSRGIHGGGGGGGAPGFGEGGKRWM